MKRALLIDGQRQTPVTVEETTDGGWVIWIPNHSPLFLRPMEVEGSNFANRPHPQQEWVFNDGEDLPENIEPQDHPQITLSDLRPSTPENSSYNWRLIVRRFPWLFAKSFEFKQAEKYAEQVAAKQFTSNDAPAKAPSQLQLDMKTIKPHLSEIIQNGQFIYGHQSTIANLLGGKNDGAFRRNRILPVEAELKRLISSTTSTQFDRSGANNGNFDPGRRVGTK